MKKVLIVDDSQLSRSYHSSVMKNAGFVTETAADGAAALEKLMLEPFDLILTESVFSISGRGVGLDVVRKTIERLRGTLTVETSVGFGTEFRLRLPATVLISRGIVIEAEQQEYILPIDSVLDL